MSASAVRRNLISWGALAVGVVLFFLTLYYINFRTAFGTIRQLGIALPLALVASGLWHLARTWAWAWCFPEPRRVGFAHLVRVRLSAEAFSYLTLRGIAGEPLKVVLLSDKVDAREATAAVALERLAYLIGTTVIVGLGSLAAILWLPLTGVWLRVFGAFAIAAGVVTLLTALVIWGRGTYVHSMLARIDRLGATSLSRGRVARFVSAVERQMLDLLRGNPRRLAVLLTATTASYLFMGLEAWVILKATGVEITVNGALAVETFSRVASFASAFIPANLGALEASSLAAVAAVGAASGGAALGLARRLRGLFWAGVGLAIYPRRLRPIQPHATDAREEAPGQTPSVLLYFPENPEAVSPFAKLAGLPIAERVLRPAMRAGYTHVLVWAPRADAGVEARMRSFVPELDGRVTVARTEAEWRSALEPLADANGVTAIGGGTVVSSALLADARGVAAAAAVRDVPAGDGWRESGIIRLTGEAAMDPAFAARALEERGTRAMPLPSGEDVSLGRARLALRIPSACDLAAAERTIRRASYKDTDANVAQFNRRISVPISIALIPTPITANQLSIALVLLGFYSAWLFSLGHYWTGVLGAFLSLAASVLDGCDGEIARLKHQESALGCWIETFGDYSYYLAIFLGITVGAVRQTHWEGFYWIGGVALAGTLVSFALLIYLRSRITAGQPEKLHSIARDRFTADAALWSRVIWRVSFCATRAAMPYGIMAFALLHWLPGIVVLAALGANIYWVSLLLKLRHLLGAGEQLAAPVS